LNVACDAWERAQSLVARLHDAVNRRDAEAIAALCAPDVQWIDPAAGGVLDGREAVLRFHRDVMFRAIPDVRLRLLEGPHLSGDGSGIAVRVAITGTMTGPLDPPGFAPTGRRIAFETGEFSVLRGDQLQRHVVMLDMLDLARQIGAMPRVGGLADRVGRRLQHLAAWKMRR
jgi:uncharacterized protein (TIGR02246 family)